MNLAALIVHGTVLGVLAVCYVVVTVTGHDGAGLLGVIGGYLGGAGAATIVPTSTPAASS